MVTNPNEDNLEKPVKHYIIAGDQRLSHSLIWEMQRHYFLHSGMQAWQDNVVPSAISSNPMMARAYSQVVFGYLRDCVAAAQDEAYAFDRTQPIYIIELGAGSGRLAHHFLHQFHGLLSQSVLADLKITYVITDFVPEIVSFWQSHPRFLPWVEAGLLDFALFDVLDKRPLRLQHTQTTLTPDTVHNPFVLIANYFFDSIPQDCFVIEDGQLCENLLTLTSTQPEPDLSDPTVWERLTLAYEPIPLAQSYYDQAIYNDILDAYETHLPDTTFTFPNVGLDCLRHWQEWANGRFLLLTSDRGITLPDALVGQVDPLPNLHGSFSLMVNYHAIGHYVTLEHGLALHSSHYQDNLQVAAYLLGHLPQNGRETRLAFTNTIVQNGPDDWFTLRQSLEPHLHTLTLPQILSLLRLTVWDADIFRDCFPTLLSQVQTSSSAWHPDVRDALMQLWDQYLPLNDDGDLADKIKTLLRTMGYEGDQLSER